MLCLMELNWIDTDIEVMLRVIECEIEGHVGMVDVDIEIQVDPKLEQ